MKSALKTLYDPNVKTYDMLFKKFKTDDKDLLEKVFHLDD